MFEHARPCQALTLPLKEKKARECGCRPTKKLNGKWLCARHRKVHEERAQAEAERNGG